MIKKTWYSNFELIFLGVVVHLRHASWVKMLPRLSWAYVQPKTQAKWNHSGRTVAVTQASVIMNFFGLRRWTPKICIVFYAVPRYFFPILIFVARAAMDCIRASIILCMWMYTHTTNAHYLLRCLLYWSLLYLAPNVAECCICLNSTNGWIAYNHRLMFDK